MNPSINFGGFFLFHMIFINVKLLWLILLTPILLPAQIKVDKAGDGWDLKVDSSLNLIKQYDSAKYKLLLDVCNRIEFWNGSYSTNDGEKIIVICAKDVKLGSINNLAAVAVHESLHLYYSNVQTTLESRKEENMCYRYEFSFLQKLPNVESWLWRHTIEQIVKTE
jgi:hypothetical protein